MALLQKFNLNKYIMNNSNFPFQKSWSKKELNRVWFFTQANENLKLTGPITEMMKEMPFLKKILKFAYFFYFLPNFSYLAIVSNFRPYQKSN